MIRKRTKAYESEKTINLVKLVGFNLKKYRMRKGYSQTRVAEKISLFLTEGKSKFELSFQQIQKYERGINKTNAIVLYAFSKILDCSMHSFFIKEKYDYPNAIKNGEVEKVIIG